MIIVGICLAVFGAILVAVEIIFKITDKLAVAGVMVLLSAIFLSFVGAYILEEPSAGLLVLGIFLLTGGIIVGAFGIYQFNDGKYMNNFSDKLAPILALLGLGGIVSGIIVISLLFTGVIG
ncbi:MAG: hypothetical protein FWD49_02595 [Firmicutes bacterium]|nr:hypothetical protein [Bacillota bacterium]